MTDKPDFSPPIWAENENYSSGPDIGTPTKVAAASTTDGHIAGVGNAPIAQNENFERATRDSWIKYYNELNSSISYWDIPENLSQSGNVSVSFETATNIGAGQIPTFNAADKWFVLPDPGATTVAGSQTIWEFTAEINIKTANSAQGEVRIFRDISGGGSETRAAYLFDVAGAGSAITVPIRSQVLLTGPGQNIVRLNVDGAGDLQIASGKVKVERIY